ncbi:MAG: aldo/keto reductase [Candidatus Limnocylindrales bacterium]
MTDPFERLRVGRTDVAVTRLGFGAASIGGLYHVVDHEVAMDTVAAALEVGVGYVDVAPQYGLGESERRLGEGLRGVPRDRYVLSTKVGRLIRRSGDVPPGADADAPPEQFPGVDPDLRTMWDMSRDGVRRSLDESRARLGIGRIDIAYIHDPDDHMAMALDEAAPTLVALRDQGVIGAVGVGANTVGVLHRFVEQADVDVILLANRYTLLDQSALATLLPACVERGVGVVIGGVMNSGLLADPRPGATFDYVEAPPELVARAQRLAAVCDRHGVSLKAAAVRFVLAHPAVVSVLAGVRYRARLEEYATLIATPIPGVLWDELRAEGLLPDEAPTPVA